MAREFKPVKMHVASYDRLRELTDRVVQGGWDAIGVERSDRPSLAAVLEEAVNQLSAKKPKRR